MPTSLDASQRAAFDRDGYVMLRGLFDAGEMRLLCEAMETDPAIGDHFYDRTDAEGGVTRMVAWNHPDHSVYGMVARPVRACICTPYRPS